MAMLTTRVWWASTLGCTCSTTSSCSGIIMRNAILMLRPKAKVYFKKCAKLHSRWGLRFMSSNHFRRSFRLKKSSESTWSTQVSNILLTLGTKCRWTWLISSTRTNKMRGALMSIFSDGKTKGRLYWCSARICKFSQLRKSLML